MTSAAKSAQAVQQTDDGGGKCEAVGLSVTATNGIPRYAHRELESFWIILNVDMLSTGEDMLPVESWESFWIILNVDMLSTGEDMLPVESWGEFLDNSQC
ncbi:hypothetical protein BaRGS_00008012 [Batillaria attramentaria]|uniref:Uncharacterized protein n=1 Tax=Batillaria attramentaria TaxID=370345 RepID=A0ABD0LMT5_9CAEN